MKSIFKFIFYILVITVFFCPFSNIQTVNAAEKNEADSMYYAPHGCKETNRNLYMTEPAIKGPDVMELQSRLLDLGYNPGPLDGIFGPSTKKAVEAFQKERGLKITGQVDYSVWEELAEGISPYKTVTVKAPPEGEIKLVIDLDRQRLTVYAGNKPFQEFPVAIGKDRTPSPVGDWKIIHKSTDWGGGFGSRWLSLDVPWGIYGIHGTNKPWSIGTRASHGCFRMYNKHVEELYKWVQLGTKVKVVGTIKHLPEFRNRTLRKGMCGSDVVELQKKLQELNLYWGFADGRFGTLTDIAIKYFQILNNLPADGIVGADTKKLLNLS